MDILKHFVDNEPLKDAVYTYFIKTLSQEVVDKTFSGQDTKGYAEAKKILEKTFNNLEGEYGKKNRSSQDSR